MDTTEFKTLQESFWHGDFGTDYIERNKSKRLLASNINLFCKALALSSGIKSCIEFGANIGMNLNALKMLFPDIHQTAIEINQIAAKTLETIIGADNVFTGSILDYNITATADLAFTKGVLIHIHPDMLNLVYKKLYEASHRYILICEYYNPAPLVVPYHGHQDRLFKRDFCGEMLAQFSDLALVDYGFTYKLDPNFPQDDTTWFLMKKEGCSC
jgi:pseudaminic acid biosynthesis-associated methylase